jgi:hypothetical protein
MQKWEKQQMVKIPFHVFLDCGRLRRLFLETWERLPNFERLFIAKSLTLITDNPVIGLATGLHDQLGTAVDTRRTVFIWLNAGELAKYDDAQTRAVIAHELAHCWLENFATEYDEQAEDETDQQTAAWGFVEIHQVGTPDIRRTIELEVQ